jgi:segregation and condensation protein A
LNIYDIPISKITGEFFEYINFLKMLDLEVAGDFILMATTLMQIKVRMLLPREVDEKGEEIDPRSDLIKALLEYKRYKEMSDELAFLESNQRKLFYRGNYEADFKVSPTEFDTLLKNITLFDLVKAFKKALMDRPKQVVHEIKKLPVTIDEQIDFILNLINTKKEVTFLFLIEGMHEKLRIIITFVALLELIKMGTIGIKETENFNDFGIYSIDNGSTE